MYLSSIMPDTETITMTQLERAERRRLAAEAVRNGEKPARVARRMKLSLRTVQYACAEHEVPCLIFDRRRKSA
jgi:hypothetical protein